MWPAPWQWSTSKKSCWGAFGKTCPRRGCGTCWVQAVTGANDAVYQLAQEREELRGMGTTAVVLVATQGGLHVAHVGDSRAYLKNGEGFRQITMDHSYVQDLVNFGQITKEEARVHPRRNIITRVLGVHPTVECDYDRFDFAPGGHGAGLLRRAQRVYRGQCAGSLFGRVQRRRTGACETADPIRRGQRRL